MPRGMEALQKRCTQISYLGPANIMNTMLLTERPCPGLGWASGSGRHTSLEGGRALVLSLAPCDRSMSPAGLQIPKPAPVAMAQITAVCPSNPAILAVISWQAGKLLSLSVDHRHCGI
jgi:hypothetical protein